MNDFLFLCNKGGLNPCFNGICSKTHWLHRYAARGIVLILVLMEYALRREGNVTLSQADRVLILVLMEYALRYKENVNYWATIRSLNPCFLTSAVLTLS